MKKNEKIIMNIVNNSNYKLIIYLLCIDNHVFEVMRYGEMLS